MRSNTLEVTKINREKLETIKAELASSSLDQENKKLLTALIESYSWLLFALQEGKMSIFRLRKMAFGPHSEKSKKKGTGTDKDKEEKSNGHPEGGDAAPPENTEESAPPAGASSEEETRAFLQEALGVEVEFPSNDNVAEGDQKKKSGHGRRGHEAYTEAEEIHVQHRDLKPGDPCPGDCEGRLYSLKPSVFVSLEGYPLVGARKFFLQRLRCSLCGLVQTALPDQPLRRHTSRAKAVLAVSKYFMGMPYYRTEKFLRMAGVPLSDATQWDMVADLAKSVEPIYAHLLLLAANADVIHYDDTPVKILSVILENKKNPQKAKGTHTTGIMAMTKNGAIALVCCGRRHGGENIDHLLDKRTVEGTKVILMSDALSSNFLSEREKAIIRALCLTHGRRNFFELLEIFPEACQVVIRALMVVYAHDAYARENKMTGEERLKYHQEKSQPVMKALHKWLTEKMEKNIVEPNSSLGKAIKYMLRHWEGLTCFLREAGAPVDNNITERFLKIPIRVRKNAPMHKTEYGAYVGGVMVSLSQTCALHNINPVEYLETIDQNFVAAAKNPQDWLPWTYKETLGKLRGPPLWDPQGEPHKKDTELMAKTAA